MQVGVEEDEVDVALQVLQAPQQQLAALRLRLGASDLQEEREEPAVEARRFGLSWFLQSLDSSLRSSCPNRDTQALRSTDISTDELL